MAQVVNFKIENYRGIRNLELQITRNFTCFIGREDSGKTTILDAIHTVLNPAFHDSDFFNCDSANIISINATLI